MPQTDDEARAARIKKAHSSGAVMRRKDGTKRPPSSAAPKPDAMRILAVEDELLHGIAESKVVRELSERFKVSTRTIERDIVRVKAEWKEAMLGHHEARRERAAANFRQLQRRCEASDMAGIPGALSAAVQAADRAARVEGVYAPDTLKILGAEFEGLQRLSSEELDAEFDAELVKLLQSMPPVQLASVLARAGLSVGNAAVGAIEITGPEHANEIWASAVDGASRRALPPVDEAIEVSGNRTTEPSKRVAAQAKAALKKRKASLA